MITTQDLIVAIKQEKSLFIELQILYRQLPATECRCRQPGMCCTYIPQMTLLEALQWVNIIMKMPDTQKRDIIKQFMTFYLTNPVQHTGCPFLQKNACGIYDYRTFACRAYGLWSRQVGDDRTQKSRQERKTLLDMWKRFGLELPPEAVQFEIDYCHQVRCISRSVISDDQLIDILEKVYQLDLNFPELQKKFEGEYHSDFSFLMTSLVLSPRKAVLGKYAVIKEIVTQGSMRRLENLLDHVKSDVFRDAVWETTTFSRGI